MNTECSICHCETCELTDIRGQLYCDECAEIAEGEGYMYLASPYSHPEAEVRRRRFDAVCKAAAKLMLAGRVVFCPIAHSHPIHTHGVDAIDHDFWLRQDKPFLDNAECVGVLMLRGWDTSVGVIHEIGEAVDAGKQVIYYTPSDFDIEEM